MSAVYECPKCNSQDVYFGNKTILGVSAAFTAIGVKTCDVLFAEPATLRRCPLKGESKGSPLALAFVLMGLGLIWTMTYYVSGTGLPIPPLGAFNIAVGFAIMLVGFILISRKR